MAESAREYLLHRFRDDAKSLRDRTDALARGAKIPGPDLATSTRMASACEEVSEMLEAIVPNDDAQLELAALVALIPLLEEKARTSGALPPVRAVYAGAATRIREVDAAEARAQMTGNGHGAAGDDIDDTLDAIDDAADDDFDDDIDDDDIEHDVEGEDPDDEARRPRH